MAPLMEVPTNAPRFRMGQVDPARKGQTDHRDSQHRKEPAEHRGLARVADGAQLIAEPEQRQRYPATSLEGWNARGYSQSEASLA